MLPRAWFSKTTSEKSGTDLFSFAACLDKIQQGAFVLARNEWESQTRESRTRQDAVYAFAAIASTSSRNSGRTSSGTTSSMEAGRASPRKRARTAT